MKEMQKKLGDVTERQPFCVRRGHFGGNSKKTFPLNLILKRKLSDSLRHAPCPAAYTQPPMPCHLTDHMEGVGELGEGGVGINKNLLADLIPPQTQTCWISLTIKMERVAHNCKLQKAVQEAFVSCIL